MKPGLWSATVLVVVVLAAACTSTPVRWKPEDIRPKGLTGDRQLERVKLWSGDSVLVWHWVVVAPDSISGYPEPKGAHLPRRVLPLSAVDSLRVGYRDTGDDKGDNAFLNDLGLIGLILLALMVP